MARDNGTFDAGGSPAAPYFGEGGRQEATEKARESRSERRSGASTEPAEGNVIPVGETRNTGVDGGPGTRDTDDEGREVVAPQVAGDFDAEPETDSASSGAGEAADSPASDGSVPQEENAPRVTTGGNDGNTVGAKEPDETGSVTANAADTGASERNAFEQDPSGEPVRDGDTVEVHKDGDSKPIDSMKKAELQEEAERRGVSTEGTVADLKARLKGEEA